VQAGERAPIGIRQCLVIDQDRSGNQRPCQAATPRLIGAGDETALESSIEGK